MTLLSEVLTALGKAQTFIADGPVILKDIESGAETEFKNLELQIKVGTDDIPSSVLITHGQPAPAPAAAAPAAPTYPAAEPSA